MHLRRKDNGNRPIRGGRHQADRAHDGGCGGLIASVHQVLQASSVGDTAVSILESSRSGLVDGVYTNAINISLSGGLVSLVPENSERGPLNINVNAGADMLSLGVEPGAHVEVEGTSLCVVGRLTVSLISACYYRSGIHMARIQPDSALRENLDVAKKTGIAEGKLSGLGGLLPYQPGKMADAPVEALNLFSRVAARLIDGFSAAFTRQDLTLNRAVSEIIGLGPGLTPASDDFLAGFALFTFAYSTRVSSLRRPRRALGKAIELESSGRTTALSEAYLKQAAAGRGNESVTGLCRAILTEGPGSVMRWTRKLLALGETSGTDTLLGIVVAGALCLMEKEQGRRTSIW